MPDRVGPPGGPGPDTGLVSPDSTGVVYHNGTLSFGGFEVTGLSLEKLQSGKLSVDLPMTAGDYELPADFDTARIKIKNDCTVRIDLQVARSDDGAPAIKLTNVTFSKDFIIKNPSAAMQPTATRFAWLNWILDILKDFLADYHLRSITLDDDNFLRAGEAVV